MATPPPNCALGVLSGLLALVGALFVLLLLRLYAFFFVGYR
jgi:hypothetical protein